MAYLLSEHGISLTNKNETKCSFYRCAWICTAIVFCWSTSKFHRPTVIIKYGSDRLASWGRTVRLRSQSHSYIWLSIKISNNVNKIWQYFWGGKASYIKFYITRVLDKLLKKLICNFSYTRVIPKFSRAPECQISIF